MSKNRKQSTPEVASRAARTLADPESSARARSLAGSVLAQAHTPKESGPALETRAGKALRDPKASATTKTLAGSVLSQSHKPR